jgi:predicted amidohydrolase YtcJ
MLAVGLTTVNDAATDLETVEFYKKLDAQDKLPVRVTGMVNCGYTYCGDQVEKVSGNKFNLR